MHARKCSQQLTYPACSGDNYIFFLILQTLQDWHLALIVVMFVAIDVIILLVYIIYNAAQGTLGAVRIRNAENPTATIGVSS